MLQGIIGFLGSRVVGYAEPEARSPRSCHIGRRLGLGTHVHVLYGKY